MIIDAHVHIFNEVKGHIQAGMTAGNGWGTVKCANDIIQVLPPLNNETVFTEEMLIRYMDYMHIDKAILLQGCFFGNQNLITEQAVSKYCGRLAGALYIEPWRSITFEMFENNLRSFAAVKIECSVETGFCGIRNDFKLSDYMWLYKQLAKYNKILVLDLGIPGTAAYQTSDVKKIIDAVGDLKIVICHLGQPRKELLSDIALLNEWKAQLSLAKYGNVWFDTASLSAYFFDEIYPYSTGRIFFEMALDIVGVDRIMTGTDTPGNSLKATYKQMLFLPEVYGKMLGLNTAEIEAMMGKNANNVYFNTK
jgi:predicted TIM-barrel fold metal-dependent hydrolase